MAERVAELLVAGGRGVYVDCTIGSGGHAAAILEAAPSSRLLGIDADREALELAKARLEPYGDRVDLVHGNYREVDSIARDRGHDAPRGVLFDLGLSSMQVDSAHRGFSFRREAPLDMRFDRSRGMTAAQLVNETPEADLADLIYALGEEPGARRIARDIVSNRPIETTTELAAIVARAASRSGRRGIHPATRTFQALRIFVNEEIENIRDGVRSAIGLLAEGGRLVVISYHSLEDALVKAMLRRESSDCVCPPRLPVCACDHAARLRLVRRSVERPEYTEIQSNPRIRSARLRVAERIA